MKKILTDSSESLKLLHLINHLKDDPYDLVKSCVHRGNDGSRKSWVLLEHRCGNESAITADSINKLMSVSNIGKTDIKGLNFS